MLLRDDLLEVYDLNRLNAHLLITCIPEPFFHYREMGASISKYMASGELPPATLLAEGVSMEGLSVTPGPIPGLDQQRIPMSNYLQSKQQHLTTTPAPAASSTVKRKSAADQPQQQPPKKRQSMVHTSRY